MCFVLPSIVLQYNSDFIQVTDAFSPTLTCIFNTSQHPVSGYEYKDEGGGIASAALSESEDDPMILAVRCRGRKKLGCLRARRRCTWTGFPNNRKCRARSVVVKDYGFDFDEEFDEEQVQRARALAYWDNQEEIFESECTLLWEKIGVAVAVDCSGRSRGLFA